MSNLTAQIATSKGPINLRLFEKEAPVTVANFVNLAKRGYYDGLAFHRVISSFMIQGGCPEGSGRGGPGYRFEDEFNPTKRHGRGTLSMANAGPGTNGSQFFITHAPQPHLDGRHTVFGEIVGPDDQKVVDAIKQGDKIDKVTIGGDASTLMAAHKERVAQWNQVLDANKR